MPLPLTDPRWNELQSSHGDTGDVVSWLTDAMQHGLSSQRLGDVINEVQHQGDTSTAMYAVAPHLISLATKAVPAEALTLLTHAGLIYASSDKPGAVPCPEFLKDEYETFARIGAKKLSEVITLARDFDSYKWAVAGLAGFLGHRRFARFLDGLELFQGRFEHVLLDKPFPPEV